VANASYSKESPCSFVLPITMRSLLPVVLLFLVVVAPILAEEPVRQRFVPTMDRGTSAPNRASFSQLVPAPPEHGGVVLHARAGVGDKFPVRERADETICEVSVLSGSDEHLVLEIRHKDGDQKCNVGRDKPVEIAVAGVKYLLSFPTVTVGPTAKHTSDQPMIMVIRR
jgi:hypothetical protein